MSSKKCPDFQQGLFVQRLENSIFGKTGETFTIATATTTSATTATGLIRVSDYVVICLQVFRKGAVTEGSFRKY